MPELITTSLFSDANLVSNYRLEDLTDSKGANTLTNTGSVTFSEGYFGNGANFGSANTAALLSVSSNLGITGGACSFSVWVKLLSEITSLNWAFVSQEDATSHVRNEIRYLYNAGTQQLNFTRSRMNVAGDTLAYTLTLGTSLWRNLLFTYDGSTVTGYVNGVSVGTIASSGNGATVGTSNFKIGASDNGTTTEAYASSLLDDVSVFSRALTAVECALVYDSGPGGLILF